MNELKISPLAPIRFYPKDYDFEQGTKFQNPDNRVSTGYDWEGVFPYPEHTAIPKQWPDGQPGIDTMVVLASGAGISSIKAFLYDVDNVVVEQINCDLWDTVSGDKHYRIWRNGNSATEITDGFYTIKITNPTGTTLYESEALLIGDWFEDYFPFEYSNFENDFGLIFDNDTYQWTGRMLIPMRLFDAVPEFEKEVYKIDPGVLTTLRTIPQRVFNFDTLPMAMHRAETFLMACGCSELWLDRIKVNFEDIPEGELIEGTNLKLISGRAVFVDFNDTYSIERVETEFTNLGETWYSQEWGGLGTITGNELELNTAPGAGIGTYALFGPYAPSEDEIIHVIVELTDNGTSDLPTMEFSGESMTVNWGTNYFSYKCTSETNRSVRLYGDMGDILNLTCTITFYTVDN